MRDKRILVIKILKLLFYLAIGYYIGVTASKHSFAQEVRNLERNHHREVEFIVAYYGLNEESENVRILELGRRVNYLKDFVDTEGIAGAYDANTGIILCLEEYACIHEIGHWKDASLGYISRQEDFQTALEAFLDSCDIVGDTGEINYYCNLTEFGGIHNNELPESGWGGYSEAYAEIYKYYYHEKRELPEQLQPFYIK